MINYTISRLEAIRNRESSLITHLILGITATDSEDGTNVYRDTKIELPTPVASLKRSHVNGRKTSFLNAALKAQMAAQIASKQAVDTIESVSYTDLPT